MNKRAKFVLFLTFFLLVFTPSAFADEDAEQLVFKADEVTILKEEREVTARGRVEFSHKDYHLQADMVTFNE
ncbi:MAG: hypothetical protein ACTSU8_05215, partial [Alphaproteobacteria bacterium]